MGVIWNRNPYKAMLREWIAAYIARHCSGRQRILTIGDGVGFGSLYLSQCGHEVTYSELSEKCLRFARQLFELTSEPVHVLDNLNGIEAGGYDIVLCLDVLEHVPEPSELVKQFARYLRPGGILIVHAPFYYVSRANSTHLDSNRRYSGDIRNLYGKRGFSLEDGRLFWEPLVLVKGTSSTLKRPIWNMVLRTTGALFAVGRFWCTPHCFVAAQMVGKGDSHWLEGLSAERAPAEPSSN